MNISEDDKAFLQEMIGEIESVDLDNSYDYNNQYIPSNDELKDNKFISLLETLLQMSYYAPVKTAIKENMSIKLKFLEEFVNILIESGKDIISKIPELNIENEEDTTEETIEDVNDYFIAVGKGVSLHLIIDEIISDLESANLLASFGKYKQAISQLRNVLELSILSMLIVLGIRDTKWEQGTFGVDSFSGMVKDLKDNGRISDSLEKEIKKLYFDYLCTATHSHKGRMNAVRSEHGFDKLRLYEFLSVQILLADIIIRLFDIVLQSLGGNIKRSLLEDCFNGKYKEMLHLAQNDIILEEEIVLSTGKIIVQRVILKRISIQNYGIEFQVNNLFALKTDHAQRLDFVVINELKGLSLRERFEIVKNRVIGYTSDSRDPQIKALNLI